MIRKFAKPIDYDDLHLVVAIAAAGNMAGAQRMLNMHLATLYRRLRALERRAGGALFERSGDRLEPTGRALPLLEAARDVQARLADMELKLVALDDRLVGPLAVTTADSLLSPVLAMLRAFGEANPGVAVSLAVDNAFADLGRREADVAIRPTTSPPETLVGRRLAEFSYGVYKAPGAAADGWVMLDSSLSATPAARWLSDHVPSGNVRLHVNGMVAAAQAAEAGWGRALLPDYLAAGRALALEQGPVAGLDSQVWLLFHPDLRSNPRVRALSNFAARWFREQSGIGHGNIGASLPP